MFNRPKDNILRYCHFSSAIGTKIEDSQIISIHEHEVKVVNRSLSNGGNCKYSEVPPKCHYCDNEFNVCVPQEPIKTDHAPNVDTLVENFKKHHNNHPESLKKNYALSCSRRNWKSEGPRNASLHTKMQTIITPSPCPFCAYIARRKTDLKKHIIRIHTQAFKHICQHCEKGFITPKDLRIHLSKNHSDRKTHDQ